MRSLKMLARLVRAFKILVLPLSTSTSTSLRLTTLMEYFLKPLFSLQLHHQWLFLLMSNQYCLLNCTEECTASVTDAISIKGTTYKLGQWLIFKKAGSSDLCVGCIETIYCFPKDSIYFKLRQHIAENNLRGFYSIHNSSIGYCVQNSQDLPDFYPLPSYSVQGKRCLTLKYSNIFM